MSLVEALFKDGLQASWGSVWLAGSVWLPKLITIFCPAVGQGISLQRRICRAPLYFTSKITEFPTFDALLSQEHSENSRLTMPSLEEEKRPHEGVTDDEHTSKRVKLDGGVPEAPELSSQKPPRVKGLAQIKKE
jgi:hypothetical protein